MLNRASRMRLPNGPTISPRYAVDASRSASSEWPRTTCARLPSRSGAQTELRAAPSVQISAVTAPVPIRNFCMRVPSDSSEVRAARLGVAGANGLVESALVACPSDSAPRGRLDGSAEDPGGLTRRTEGHVLAGLRDDDRDTEDARRDLTDGLGLRRAPDEQRALRLQTLVDERLEPVGLTAEQPFDEGPREVRAGGGLEPNPVQSTSRVGQVRGAFALEVRDEHEPARPGRSGQREGRQLVVVDAEECRGRVEHPGCVEGACQGQEVPGRVGEAADKARCIVALD